MSNEIKHFYEFGEFRFSPKEKCLWRAGELVRISPKALEVLNLLLENTNEIVTREAIIEEVWKGAYVEEANLTVAISNLRKVFNGDGKSRKAFIQTVPKKGYRFTEDVNEIFEEPETKTQVFTEPSLAEEPLSGRRPKRYRWVAVAVLLATVFFLSSFSFWFKYSDGSELSPVPTDERSIKSIAVLPLKNLGKGNETLAIGLTDNLISRLGRLNRFVVRPLSAVEKFSESGKDSLEFGRELKVDAVVVGTIQQENERLRVNLRVLDVRDGAQILSEKYDETEDDIFRLQDNLSLQVANNLAAKISKEETEKLTTHETENSDAFKEYSKGQFFLAKRTKKGIEKAIKHFEVATNLDKNYALAYAGIAEGYLLMGDSAFGYSKPQENIEKIRNSLDKALDLDPGSAEIYAIKASYETLLKWDVVAAEENYKKSLSLNPKIAQTHQWYAWNLLAQKRFDEAFLEMKAAYDLDPSSRIIVTELGLPLLYQGKFDEALPYFRKAVEMDGNFYHARFRLWYALSFNGKYTEAFEQLKAIKKLSSEDDAFYNVLFGITSAMTGKRKIAAAILDKLERRKKKGEYISPVFLASLASALDEKMKAFDWLKESVDERNDFMLYLDIAPDYENLRDDPRFTLLLKRIDSKKPQ